MEPNPRIGDVVHYVSYGTPGGEFPSACRAAIVTEVRHPGLIRGPVCLAVLNPSGMFFNEDIAHQKASDTAGGTWHWPEK